MQAGKRRLRRLLALLPLLLAVPASARPQLASQQDGRDQAGGDGEDPLCRGEQVEEAVLLSGVLRDVRLISTQNCMDGVGDGAASGSPERCLVNGGRQPQVAVQRGRRNLGVGEFQPERQEGLYGGESEGSSAARPAPQYGVGAPREDRDRQRQGRP
ncbi:hypothetical protein AQJ91_36930 [Streptomyces dysideae]|uniref:Uncharacterized protein n=1 Tax=Streptomyces dysideae TaxID=909626 RepID=A0A101USS6_9ACTN|nr:hypothetical protein AQJ91_36930 [Streptomyces dysideae]